jgi:ATPase subunit of ABC transporter with duplicated ATPase domains
VLEQDHFQYEDVPIVHVVMMGHAELWEAMERKEAILANAHEHFDAEAYAEAEDIVIQHDGYSLESRASEILEGLNIPTSVHHETLSTLSGGFKLRVLLAQTLASQPDVLLLDEPTNHLDILSIRWLEKFLVDFAGCVMVVSHDHRFLNNVCTHILDVDYVRVTMYKGNYDDFVLAKQSDMDRMEGEADKREKEIADHKAFIDRFKAKASKARQAQSKAKRVEKIVIEELPRSSRRYPLFKFVSRRPSGKEVLHVEHLSKAFADNEVLRDVSFRVERGDRLAIIGPNGIGKSTLLKIAMGIHQADHGKAEWGYEAHVGYFAQDHHEVLGEAEHTVETWLWDRCPTAPVGFVRGKLAEVLFGKDEVGKKVSALSGGEGARLVFCGLSVVEPNVLVLDEPTNHLDLEGIEALAKGLQKYDGTVLFVSHDRWFVSELATRILEIRADGIEDFRGSYDEYLERCGDDHLDAEAVLRRAREGKKKGAGATDAP